MYVGIALVNSDELDTHTDPTNPDTDSDGVADAEEINTTATDPLNADSDDEGLLDGEEVNTYSTNPNEPDTDADGQTDYYEVHGHSDPLNPDSYITSVSGEVVYTGRQSLVFCVLACSAADDWTAEYEITSIFPRTFTFTNLVTLSNYWIKVYHDADTNGVRESWETISSYSNNPVYLTGMVENVMLPINAEDSEPDDLPDWWEMLYFGDLESGPSDDPDADGYDNLQEYIGNSDPNDPESRPGLVAYYKFDEPAWTGASNEVMDSSWMGNHGTVYGGLEPTEDWFGRYAKFDGSNDYIEVLNDETLQIDGDLTVSFWYLPVSAKANSYFLRKNGSNGEFGFRESGNGYLYYDHGSDDGSYGIYQHENEIQNYHWHHMVLVRDVASRGLKLYQDGRLVRQHTYPENVSDWPSVSQSPLRIGHTTFHGGLDEIKILKRQWSSNEVFEAYDGDGMPKLWEEANGLDPSDASDASLDADDDGVSNLDEFINGTDPNTPE
jgi:hypothetical protein